MDVSAFAYRTFAQRHSAKFENFTVYLMKFWDGYLLHFEFVFLDQ